MELDTDNQQEQPQQNISLQQPTQFSAPNRKRSLLVLSGVIILLIIVAGGSYYLGLNSSNSDQPESTQIIPSPMATEEFAAETSLPTPATTPISTTSPISYDAPPSWNRTQMINNSLTVCLPPKWESDQWGNVYFNRDPGYRPNVTYIQEIPYSSGSRREAYFKFWESEYPNVRELVSIGETNIGSNTALTIYSANPSESKISPDGNLAVVWFGNNKLWKAGLSGWNSVNDSQAAFLKDFYTMISCSFAN